MVLGDASRVEVDGAACELIDSPAGGAVSLDLAAGAELSVSVRYA